MSKKVCPSCSAISETEKSFCSECGTSYLRQESTNIKVESDEGGGLATAGLVCGIASFILFPFVLGPIGIVLGSISWNKGHPRGKAATITSIVGTIAGLLITIYWWNTY